MSVRSKILLVLISVLVLYEAADVAIQRTLVYSRFVQLERAEAVKNINRCDDAINREVFHLSAFNADWAYWDDAYEFVAKPSQGFIQTNLTESTFKDSKLDLMFFYNTAGQSVWGKVYENDQNEITLKYFGPSIGTDNPLFVKFDQKNPNTCIKSGILMTERGPMIIVSRPILQTDKSGPSRGILVMGKFLDQEAIDDLKNQTNVDFEVKPIQAGLDACDQKLVAAINATGEPAIKKDNGYLLCSTVLRDLEGNGTLLVTANIPRSITQEGKSAIKFALTTGFISCALVLAVLLIVLQKSIVQPLSSLTEHVTAIAKNSDLTARLNMPRSDEIGTLAKEFDSMLEQLAASRKRLLEQSYNTGKAELASGVLHNLRNSLTPVVSKIEMLRDDLHGSPITKIELARTQLESPQLDPNRKDDLERYMQLASRQLAGICMHTQDELDTLACRIKDIEDILGSASKSERSQRPIETVRLEQLLNESIPMVSDELVKNIRIEQDPSINTAEPFKADRIALIQVFVNLIVNAAEAINITGTEHGRIVISASNQEDGLLHIMFTDNGHGATHEALTKLFQRGFSTKNKPTQSGIGLHWCANTISAMKGRIWIESPGPGKGASVHITMPTNTKISV